MSDRRSFPARLLNSANLERATHDRRDGGAGRLHRCDHESCRLTRANLRQAKLTGANLENADLSGCNLTGAELDGAILIGARMTLAILDGADLTNALTDAPLGRNIASLATPIAELLERAFALGRNATAAKAVPPISPAWIFAP